LIGVAVNVTDWPLQTGLALTAILTEAAEAEVTVMLTALEVAGEPVTQVRSEVIITVITSAFERADDVNVLLFVPAFDPFICHW